jgi:hypothetical protein
MAKIISGRAELRSTEFVAIAKWGGIFLLKASNLVEREERFALVRH